VVHGNYRYVQPLSHCAPWRQLKVLRMPLTPPLYTPLQLAASNLPIECHVHVRAGWMKGLEVEADGPTGNIQECRPVDPALTATEDNAIAVSPNTAMYIGLSTSHPNTQRWDHSKKMIGPKSRVFMTSPLTPPGCGSQMPFSTLEWPLRPYLNPIFALSPVCTFHPVTANSRSSLPNYPVVLCSRGLASRSPAG
jgi:hypothetical protein